MKNILYILIFSCVTNYAMAISEYKFAAYNVGKGVVLFEPFDVCGYTPLHILPSTCSEFAATKSLDGTIPHVKKIELKWQYWETVESYKNGEKGINCKKTVTIAPPCNASEYYGFYFCFNQKEVFLVYRIVWNSWKDQEYLLPDGCPLGFEEDLVGELAYFKKNPNAKYADFFYAMQKKYDYNPSRRKNSSYFLLKWFPGKVIHYRKTDGTPVYWGDIAKIDDKNFFKKELMRYAFVEIIQKIASQPDIVQNDFTLFIKESGKENKCFISNDLIAWKQITTAVVTRKMLNPNNSLAEKIDASALKNQIAIIGVTPYKIFTLTFENIFFDEIKLDTQMLFKLNEQGYFSKIFVNKK